MDHFTYKDGVLCAEETPLDDIAAAVGTPFYVYSSATLTRHFQVFEQAMAEFDPLLICFAVKANGNLGVLATLAQLGAGADVVSGGEFRRALAAGIPGDKVVFSGVGKTREEMRFALEHNVRQFNVESEPELEALSEVAASMDLRAPVALRVNPDVDPKTHAKISTGKAETKFGVPMSRAREIYARAAALPGIRVEGVDMHIGSQLTDVAPFEAAFERMRDLTRDLLADGCQIKRFDLGGGLGAPYARDNNAPPLPVDYAAAAKRALGPLVRELGAEVVVEPGRVIAANAGLLVSRVIYTKQGEGRRFVILDAAMNDLMRPIMYDAWHDIIPARERPAGAALSDADFVGPICETGDIFAKDRPTVAWESGDLAAVRSAGAYAASMASEYNTRPVAAEVMVDGGKFEVVRRRQTYDDILSRENAPSWLSQT